MRTSDLSRSFQARDQTNPPPSSPLGRATGAFVRLGYPPAIIQKRERERYLEALANADRGDPGPLGELIARAILDNLTRFILPGGAGPAKLLPMESLTIKDLSVVALRYAAMRGRLKAIKAADGS